MFPVAPQANGERHSVARPAPAPTPATTQSPTAAQAPTAVPPPVAVPKPAPKETKAEVAERPSPPLKSGESWVDRGSGSDR